MARRRPGLVRAATVALASAVVVAVLPVTAAEAARPPSSPRAVTAVPSDAAVKVTWRPPRSMGGRRIDKYQVRRWADGVPTASATVPASRRSLTVRDLVNGTTYSFSVRAHNRAGWSKPSAVATAVPRTVPGAPEGLGAEQDARTVLLSWSPPGSDGGAAVEGYRVERSLDRGGSWAEAATPSGTEAELTSLQYGATYLFRVRALNIAGAGPPTDPVAVTPRPPECPDPLPSPGPYLRLSCDPADGVVVHHCTNPDWEDLNGAVVDGCEATRQMPPFVPSSAIVGADSAQALADALAGSFWLSGYPGSRDPGDFWTRPLVLPVTPQCGGPTVVACPNGVPQDPPPTIRLDFAPYQGAAARSTGVLVQNASRVDVTHRARVSTSSPIPMTVQGVDCTVAIDSQPGSTPDWRVDAQVGFPDFGWEQHGEVGNVSLTQVEDADLTLQGGFLCQLAGTFHAVARDQVQDLVQSAYVDRVIETCGAQEPYWWQTCRPVVEAPPPAPPEPEPTSDCPEAPPPAGPYLTLSCHPQTGALVGSCDPAWTDANGDPADGCERSVEAEQAPHLDAVTDQAFVDRVSGTFFLGGYPDGVGQGPRHFAPNPRPIEVEPCVHGVFGCPSSGEQERLPGLQLDLSHHDGDDEPRRQASFDEQQHLATLVLRGRLTSTAPFVFDHQGVTCWISVDSRRGAREDVAFPFAAADTGAGTVLVLGFQTGAQLAELLRLEDEDLVVGPHRWCEWWAQSRRDEARWWVYDALVAWAAREGDLCGAVSPYHWQGCAD